MGIKLVTKVTCDMCGSDCGLTDGQFEVMVNGGDGRDVGPAYMKGTVTFYQPYGCSKGVVCTHCKNKWLKNYVSRLGNE